MFNTTTIILIVIILSLIYFYYFTGKKETKALSIILGENNLVKGVIYFDPINNGNATRMYGKIINLPPGIHAIHVHEYGDLTDGCKSLGGHYNPFNKNHSGRLLLKKDGTRKINYNRHVGDLGNIYVDKNGVAKINLIDPLIKLTGKHNIMGRSIVIHTKKDDLGKGGTKESLTTGSAGQRLACGIIAHRK